MKKTNKNLKKIEWSDKELKKMGLYDDDLKRVKEWERIEGTDYSDVD